MVKLEQKDMPAKWRMTPRSDLLIAHYAAEVKGWSVMVKESDLDHLESPKNILHFQKGILRVWPCKEKGQNRWCVAEITPGGTRYYNHRYYDEGKLPDIIINEKPWPVDGH